MSTEAQLDTTTGVEIPDEPPASIDGIPLVTKPAKDWLNGPQQDDYRQHRYALITWLLERGKNPDREDGYATSTAKARASRIDQFYRWVWDREQRYTTRISTQDADEYIKQLAREGQTGQDDRANKQKALMSLFEWRSRRFGDSSWEPDEEWREHNAGEKDQPHFTDRERSVLRDAVLDFRSVPHYNSLDPEERAEMKVYLAQRLGKSKDEVSPEDFGSVPTRKYASLVRTTLDLGLRPCEVAEFRVDWYDPQNNVVIIPEEYSQKNEGRWVCTLRKESSLTLSQWIEERETLGKYEGSDRMWLTKYGNPYGSGSLNDLLTDLCEHAGIAKRDRTWYSIRRSTANVVGNHATPEHARDQLRHKQVETTMRYIQPEEQEVRDALNRGG